MDMNPHRFILYLTTDGAGTHIVRSLFMDLHKRGESGPIDHSAFWAKAVAARDFPDSHHFDGARTNRVVYRELCRSNGWTLPADTLDDDAIFDAFDHLYSRYPLILDFSKHYTTVYGSKSDWNRDCVDRLQSTIIGYIQSGRKVDIRMIAQMRNPLDHVVSLYERFGNEYTLEHFKRNVIENIRNTGAFIEKLNSKTMEDQYVRFTLDELILDFEKVADRIDDLIGRRIARDFYLSRISLNKWFSCEEIYPYLSDDELMDIARAHGYTYRHLPGRLRFLYRIYGRTVRTLHELKLMADTELGRVNPLNSINSKHRVVVKSRLLSRLIKVFRGTGKHRDRYNKSLLEHNKE
jgi:hypothetical protein